MSMGHFLVEEGVEVELDTDMDRVISFLHREVPKFSHGGSGYWLSPVKGVLGTSWLFLIKTYIPATNTMLEGSLGLLKAETLGSGAISFRIPPRTEWETLGEDSVEGGEVLFASFVFQMLNALQEEGLIHLPGVLPVR